MTRTQTFGGKKRRTRTRKIGGNYGAHNPKKMRTFTEKIKRHRNKELSKISNTGKVKKTVKLLGGRRRRR